MKRGLLFSLSHNIHFPPCFICYLTHCPIIYMFIHASWATIPTFPLCNLYAHVCTMYYTNFHIIYIPYIYINMQCGLLFSLFYFIHFPVCFICYNTHFPIKYMFIHASWATMPTSPIYNLYAPVCTVAAGSLLYSLFMGCMYNIFTSTLCTFPCMRRELHNCSTLTFPLDTVPVYIVGCYTHFYCTPPDGRQLDQNGPGFFYK